MDLQYWRTRQSSAATPLANAIKRNVLASNIAGTVFSVRMGDELFLRRVFRLHKVTSALDIACGAGKAVIGALPYAAGVDIAGAPLEDAKRKGYRDVHCYKPPEYRFSIGRLVDAIICVNLNAHISPEAFLSIIGRAIDSLKHGGKLIVVCEFDNDGFSYRWMRRRSQQRWQRVVTAMDHDFLEKEVVFLDRIQSQTKYRLLYRRPIIAGALPAIHYRWFFQTRKPDVRNDEITKPIMPFTRAALLAADVPLGLWNSVQCACANHIGEAFQVGYVFDVY